MTTNSPPDQSAKRFPYTDVQVELTRMVFDGLSPSLLVSSCGIAAALVTMAAQSVKDGALFLIVSGMLIASFLMICVVSLFNARANKDMTPAEAFHWEFGYGVSMLLFCALLATATVHNFRVQDLIGKSWCTLGSFAVCSSIIGRRSLRGWIIQLCGCVVLLALIVSLIAWGEKALWPTAILPALYLYLFCKSANVTFQTTVEQIRAHRQLAFLAGNDELTGLANRRHFISKLHTDCQRAQPFAILYIDLDRFKAVNDCYGHAVGDALLRVVGERLRRAVRASDTVARLGGDEFAILQAAPANEETARSLAERINRGLRLPFRITGIELQISASIGIRLATSEDSDPESLTRSADTALYSVKQSGRGRFAFAGRSSDARSNTDTV